MIFTDSSKPLPALLRLTSSSARNNVGHWSPEAATEAREERRRADGWVRFWDFRRFVMKVSWREMRHKDSVY